MSFNKLSNQNKTAKFINFFYNSFTSVYIDNFRLFSFSDVMDIKFSICGFTCKESEWQF